SHPDIIAQPTAGGALRITARVFDVMTHGRVRRATKDVFDRQVADDKAQVMSTVTPTRPI
ncbi:MAG: hypothetical protein ACYCST_20900, partial [Acidimicrobiales bacterium]